MRTEFLLRLALTDPARALAALRTLPPDEQARIGREAALLVWLSAHALGDAAPAPLRAAADSLG